VGEQAGLTLYGFVNNDAVTSVDTDGRQFLKTYGWPVGGPGPMPLPRPYPGPPPWPTVPPNYPLPPRPSSSQFSICQRDIIERDCKDKCVNALGGQHQYVEYKHAGPVIGPLQTEGWGFARTTAAERAFNPNKCDSCRRVPNNLQFGSGQGRNGFDATDEEIWDCVKNAPPSQAYDWLDYNCKNWASEATARCGIDCSTNPLWPPWGAP
jgi:hypothetical protein